LQRRPEPLSDRARWWVGCSAPALEDEAVAERATVPPV